MVPTLPLPCPAAPLQLQGVPAGETPQRRYAFVNKLRTYALAQVRGQGGVGGTRGVQGYQDPGPCSCHGTTAKGCPWAQVSAWCQPVPIPQGYCQDKYRGQLASVHSSARNQELQKLARTYNTFISPWIGAVTSCKVRGHQGQGPAKAVLGAGQEISCGLL